MATSWGAVAGELDGRLEQMGFVRVTDAAPEVEVSLMYARDDNFTGVVLYTDLHDAWLRPEAGKALAKAQRFLAEEHPGYRLKVYDAARPMSVQRRMYDVVAGTDKAHYVSNPRRGGGMHNYGMAVDLTVVDAEGNELDMGTDVDHLGIEASVSREQQLVAQGKLTPEQQKNRQILRRAMQRAGWKTIYSEWWHFNLCSRAEAKRRYKVLDF